MRASDLDALAEGVIGGVDGQPTKFDRHRFGDHEAASILVDDEDFHSEGIMVDEDYMRN